MKPPKAKQLPSGMWYCRIRVDGKDISITRSSEKVAIAEAMAIKAGIIEMRKEQTCPTLAAALRSYIDARDGLISESTIRGYMTIRDHRFEKLQGFDLGKITAAQWQAEIKREAKRLSPKTVANSWALIAAVLRENELAIPRVVLPAAIVNEHEYLLPSQIPVFLDAIHGQDMELPALLGLHSLRRSEILKVTWRDIDLRQQLIHVHGAAVFDKNQKLVYKAANKNETSYRSVPIMIPRLAEMLAELPRSREHLVCCNPNTIWAQVNRTCRSAGLPEIGTHGLRHSFASLAYSLGVSEEATMRMGGWKDIQTMRKIYTHISKVDLASAAKRMSEFYRKAYAPKNDDENGDEVLLGLAPQGV